MYLLYFTIYDGISTLSTTAVITHYQRTKDNHYLQRQYSQIVLSDSIWSSTAADKIGILYYFKLRVQQRSEKLVTHGFRAYGNRYYRSIALA